MVYIVALYFRSVQLSVIQALNDRNILNVQLMPQSILREIRKYASIIIVKHELLWSGPDTIINACDSMHNAGQTRIFYKPGQNCLTQTKIDLVDPTQFQLWL